MMADKKGKAPLSAEQKALKAFREKQERKYGRIAKKRLAILSEKLEEDKLLVDMSDDEFNKFVEILLAYKKAYKQAREPQQQRPVVNQQPQQRPVANPSQPQQPRQ